MGECLNSATCILPIHGRATKGLAFDEVAAVSDDATRIRRHSAQFKHFKLIRNDAGRYQAAEHRKDFVIVWTKSREVFSR